MNNPVDIAMKKHRQERALVRLAEVAFLALIGALLAWPAAKAWTYYNVIQDKATAYDEITTYLEEYTMVVK